MAGLRTLTADKVLTAAETITEKQGYRKLSLKTIAATLGVKTPSLYNHVSGIEDVQLRLAMIVLSRMEAAVKNAAIGRSGEDALREIAYAYYCFAIEHAELYRAFTNAPALGGQLTGLADTLLQVLKPFGLDETDEVNFVRTYHSALHGFVSLEQSGFFNSKNISADESFRALVENQLTILNSLRGKLL